MSEEITEYNLPNNAYAAFDAVTLRELLVKRLVEKGVFTDQVFIGSNMSSLIDVMAYSYHVLMFYLNQTSSETMFTESTIYENINRIVKLLNYSPLGYRTPTVGISVNATSDLPTGSYTIPRYSFVNVGGTKYSINRDISFTKTLTIQEEIESIGNSNLLHQGEFIEYPIQTAIGEEFESMTLSLTDSVSTIDSSNLDIYVRSGYDSGDRRWKEYSQTESLFLEAPGALAFEKRLNERGLYEFKFGNDIYGRKLDPGDEVLIMYLKSDREKGVIGANTLDKYKLTLYNSSLMSRIINNIKTEGTIYLTYDQATTLGFTNKFGSTKPGEKETVESIKENAPAFFSAQNRLITARDFKQFIDRTYGNILLDTTVVNNNDYLDGHMKYLLQDLGISNPSLESRVLYNHIHFSSSTNFNNVYIYAVPRFEMKTSGTKLVSFLSPATKTAIVNSLDVQKTLTSDPIIMDPVYIALDLGTTLPGEEPEEGIRAKTRLIVKKTKGSQRDDDTIRQEIVTHLTAPFGSNSRLGQLIDLNAIYNNIISIDGVDDAYMTRTDDADYTDAGISLLMWNPVYPKADMNIISQNIKLPYFKFPYLYDDRCLLSKITVV